jgi:hypothetical protein
MTDNERLLAIACFLLNEGTRAEDGYKQALARKTVKYREADALDYLELIELRTRWDYFRELDVVIGNVLYGRHDPRPQWFPLS